jgi:hypothetical protein
VDIDDPNAPGSLRGMRGEGRARRSARGTSELSTVNVERSEFQVYDLSFWIHTREQRLRFAAENQVGALVVVDEALLFGQAG